MKQADEKLLSYIDELDRLNKIEDNSYLKRTKQLKRFDDLI